MIEICQKSRAPATRPASRQGSSSSPLKRIRASDAPLKPRHRADGLARADIQPADCYGYFDTVKFLSMRPIPEDAMAMLHAHCKHLDVRAHGEWIRPKRGAPYQVNIWPWLYRIEVQVPQRACLEYFARRRGLKLTKADPALDLTFDNEEGPLLLLRQFEECLVQPRQGRKHSRIIFDNGGISTGRRSRGRYLTAYADEPCRIDGIADCFHVEGRYAGKPLLASIRLNHPKDLLSFDHAAFWREIEDQGHLLQIDRERLGRFHENRTQKQRRASDPKPHYRGRSQDHARGSLLYRIYGIDQYGNISVQHFIRSYGRGPFISKVAGSIFSNCMVDTAI